MSTSIVNLSRLASVMSLNFEFQEQLRALEGATQKEKQIMSTLSSEINQFQDEVREGYVPKKKATPDYGEPWTTESFNTPIGDTGDYEGCLEVYTRENQDRVAEAWNPEDKHEAFFARIVACVNACAGMADPSAEIQAMRDAIKDHLDAFAWMDGPEGWTEACQKLQLFIKP